MWYGWMNEALGVWLALAPAVSLSVPSARLNNLLTGTMAAVVSAYTPEKTGEARLGVIAGAWLAIASSFKFFVVGDGYLWNNVISGLLIFTSGYLAQGNPPARKDS